MMYGLGDEYVILTSGVGFEINDALLIPSSSSFRIFGFILQTFFKSMIKSGGCFI